MSQQLLAGPLLYGLGNDQVIVWWQTDLQGAANRIVHWTGGGAPEMTVTAATSARIDAVGRPVFAHAARVRGLAPGKLHYFRVLGDELETATKVFSTYPDDGTAVRIGVFGASVGNAANTLPGLGYTVSTLRTLGVQGYLGTGGYVEEGRHYSSWQAGWLSVMGTELRTRGFFGCRGTGDGEGDLGTAMLPLPGGSQDFAALTIGKARVLVLNSMPASRPGLAPGGAQAEWLLHQAALDPAWTSAAYRILIVHHPSRTTLWAPGQGYGTDGTDEFLRRQLDPLLKVSGADVVLFGASRSYQRGSYLSTHPRSKHRIHHIVTGGGGGAKHSQRSWEWDPPDDPGVLVDSSNYIVLVLDISGSLLTVEAYDMETAEVVDWVQVVPHSLL